MNARTSTIKQPLVSIVIPTYNRQEQVVALLQSIASSDYPLQRLEILVVDNAADATLEKKVKAVLPQAIVLVPGDNLFSNGARRLGAAAARGEYVFLLDDDNTLEAHCLTALVDALERHSELGAVGPIMLNGDSDVIWCAGGRMSSFGTPQYVHSKHRIQDLSLPPLVHGIEYFPNACMVRRSVLKDAPLDDQAFPHNWAETDFCLRILSAGYQMATVTAAVERHHIGYTGRLTRLGSEKTYDQTRSRILFRRRHLPAASDWVRFWGVIFPVSTAFYLWHIVRSSESKTQLLKAYIRGTLDGLSTPITKTPIAS